MIAQSFSNAWSIYRARFGLIAAVVATIWIPCELIDSYLTYFVIDPENLRAQIRLSQFLDNFIGIIATAGVTCIALNAGSERKTSYGEALGTGFKSWGRMWITRFLFGVAVIVGLLLLIIPGIFLAVRLGLGEAVVIAEGKSGPAALRRSYELTRGRFWPLLGIIGLIILICLPLLLLTSLPAAFIPQLDHWLINAGTMLAVDIIVAFFTIVFLCSYRILAEPNDSEPPSLPVASAA